MSKIYGVLMKLEKVKETRPKRRSKRVLSPRMRPKEVVADKGYHGNQALVDLEDLEAVGVRYLHLGARPGVGAGIDRQPRLSPYRALAKYFESDSRS